MNKFSWERTKICHKNHIKKIIDALDEIKRLHINEYIKNIARITLKEMQFNLEGKNGHQSE